MFEDVKKEEAVGCFEPPRNSAAATVDDGDDKEMEAAKLRECHTVTAKR